MLKGERYRKFSQKRGVALPHGVIQQHGRVGEEKGDLRPGPVAAHRKEIQQRLRLFPHRPDPGKGFRRSGVRVEQLEAGGILIGRIVPQPSPPMKFDRGTPGGELSPQNGMERLCRCMSPGTVRLQIDQQLVPGERTVERFADQRLLQFLRH